METIPGSNMNGFAFQCFLGNAVGLVTVVCGLVVVVPLECRVVRNRGLDTAMGGFRAPLLPSLRFLILPAPELDSDTPQLLK